MKVGKSIDSILCTILRFVTTFQHGKKALLFEYFDKIILLFEFVQIIPHISFLEQNNEVKVSKSKKALCQAP